MSYIQDKLDDVRNQIIIAFKHLEHGVSFFNGIPVMEDFEEESMNQIIDEALKQSLTDYHNHIVEKIYEPILVGPVHNLDSYVLGYRACLNKVQSLQDTNPKKL